MNIHPTIVVAETEPSCLEMMQEVLIDAGYPSLILVEPQHSYPVAVQHQPDVLILDIAPERIGWPALERIKRDPRTNRIPVLVYSTDVKLLMAKKAWLTRNGCISLEKPFMLDDLFAALTPIIGPPLEALPAESQ